MTEHAVTGEKARVERHHCNECGGLRNHLLKANLPPNSYPDDVDSRGDPYAFDIHQLWQCQGCDEVLLVHRHWDGGGQVYGPDEDGEFIFMDEKWKRFPPMQSRPRPPWLEQAPKYLQPVLTEVYVAAEMQARTLAAIGVRTVIDRLAVKLVGDVGGFEKKLDALVTKGELTKKDRKLLGVAVDVGNAAAHRSHHVSKDALTHLLRVMEYLLAPRVELRAQSARLKKATPKRPRRAKKKPASRTPPPTVATP